MIGPYGMSLGQQKVHIEYLRAKRLYDSTPLDQFPAGLSDKGSALHTRRRNRLAKADRAMYEAGIGHLR